MTRSEIKKVIRNICTEKARQEAKTNDFIKSFIITNTQTELNLKAEKKRTPTIPRKQIEKIFLEMIEK